MLCLYRGMNSKVVEKVVCCARTISAVCLEEEICSEEPWDEKRSLSARAMCSENALVGRARV